MDTARPLRDVFADLARDETAREAYRRDPDGFLGTHGHTDLPGDLVAEAVVSYADLAPLATAEHLAPVVMAHAAVPTDDAAAFDDSLTPTDPLAGLDLLATTPPPAPADDGEEPDAGVDDAIDDIELDDHFGTGDPDALDHAVTDPPTPVVDEPELDEMDHPIDDGMPELAVDQDPAFDGLVDDLDTFLDDVEGPPEEPEEDIADM